MAAFATAYDITPATDLMDAAKNMQIYVGQNLGIRSTGVSGN
jgi:hypothetical protein